MKLRRPKNYESQNAEEHMLWFIKTSTELTEQEKINLLEMQMQQKRPLHLIHSINALTTEILNESKAIEFAKYNVDRRIEKHKLKREALNKLREQLIREDM